MLYYVTCEACYVTVQSSEDCYGMIHSSEACYGTVHRCFTADGHTVV